MKARDEHVGTLLHGLADHHAAVPDEGVSRRLRLHVRDSVADHDD